ncbi:MAG: FG-GAP-like repeat-containing protein [Acidobacteriota bacterium]
MRRFVVAAVLMAVAGLGSVAQGRSLFPNPVFPVGSFPTFVLVVDLDGDGLDDLVTLSFVDGEVAALLGDDEGRFGPAVRIPLGSRSFPFWAATGDFNQDDIPDLVVTKLFFGETILLTGRGDGSFEPPAAILNGGFPGGVAVAVADINADGFDDIAVANGSTDTVELLLGLGRGLFAPAVSLAVAGGPFVPPFADLDADEKIDLVVSNAGANVVSVLLGQGDGSFAEPVRYGVGELPSEIVVHDLDDDGIPDLAVADRFSNDVSVLLGEGDGSFRPPSAFRVLDQPFSLTSGDFNNDQIEDLATAPLAFGGFPVEEFSVLYGRGDGSFRNEDRLAAPGGFAALRTADIDRDGLDDLVGVSASFNSPAVFFNNGDGTIGPTGSRGPIDVPVVVPQGEVEGAPRFALADFDRDGRIDIITSQRGTRGRAAGNLLAGAGDGTFDLTESFSLPRRTGDIAADIAAADLNADGLVDFISVGDYNDDPPFLGILSLLQQEDGSFSPIFSITAGSSGQLLVDDFNEDTHEDLILPKQGGPFFPGSVRFFPGRGDGTFAGDKEFPVGVAPINFAAGDLNEDGHLDIVVADLGILSLPGFGDVSVLLGNGKGDFTASDAVTAGDNPVNVALMDMNGDDHLDLIMAGVDRSPPGGVLTLHLGRGDGTFQPKMTLMAGQNFSSITSGDYNADGVLDLAVSSAPSLRRTIAPIVIFLGAGEESDDDEAEPDEDEEDMFPDDGDQIFQQPPRIFGIKGFSRTGLLRTADFNRDGRMDLVAAVDGGLVVLLNQGPFPDDDPDAKILTDASLECTSPAGAEFLLDGTASSDPDSSPGTNDDIEQFEWFVDFGTEAQRLLGTGETLPVTLPLGDHTVTLRVTDKAGAADTDAVTVSLIDTTPPHVSFTASPAILWPPNHRLVPIAVSASQSDLCGPATGSLIAVSTNEADSGGAGDGATTGDIRMEGGHAAAARRAVRGRLRPRVHADVRGGRCPGQPLSGHHHDPGAP